MGRTYKLSKDSILDRLQRPKGYQSCRIRPNFTGFPRTRFAEVFTPDKTRERKSWKTLADEEGNLRRFLSPEEAAQALVERRGEPFTEPHLPYYIQLMRAQSEELHWYMIVQQGERQSPGSLETMVEDAAARLVAAMRELRENSELDAIAMTYANTNWRFWE